MSCDTEGTIELIGMEFHARHGCLEEERKNGNTFLVDFCGKAEVEEACKTDELAHTVDYSKVYGIIAREMAKPSDLLEHVAYRIVEALENELPELHFIQVRVSKKNPPLGGPCSWSRFTATAGSSNERNDHHHTF